MARMVEVEQRFWDKVDFDPSNPERCWPWTASKMHRGYGQFSMRDVYGKQYVIRAHRLAYEFEFGPIPELGPDGSEAHIDHTCHDPALCRAGEGCPHRACCNPFHMRVTSNRENHQSGRVDGWAGARASVARMTPAELAAKMERARKARWNAPGARQRAAERKRQWWASLSGEARTAMEARKSKGLRAAWARKTPQERAAISAKVQATIRRNRGLGDVG